MKKKGHALRERGKQRQREGGRKEGGETKRTSDRKPSAKL